MRFVPTNCLRIGMKVGDNLFNQQGDLMLSYGTVLTEDYIESIDRLKYNGIYIEDDISEDIAIINVVSDKIRNQTIKGIKSVFLDLENNSHNVKESFEKTRFNIEQIVDEICNNPNLMINMVDMKVFDDYTYFHSVNVAVLSIVLGVGLGMEKEELCNLGYGGLLHDIGKVFINKNILNKQGRLTHEEAEEIKKHSEMGCEHIKKGFGVSHSSYMGILDHHEKYGGGGYPNNLQADKIAWYGRIISVADVYDALTSDRPYRKSLLPSEATEYIMASVMTQFDPKVVDVFVQKVAPYPVGTCVKLSDGNMGIVVENRECFGLRPKIRIFKVNEQFIDEPYVIDLMDHNCFNITIMAVV